MCGKCEGGLQGLLTGRVERRAAVYDPLVDAVEPPDSVPVQGCRGLGSVGRLPRAAPLLIMRDRCVINMVFDDRFRGSDGVVRHPRLDLFDARRECLEVALQRRTAREREPEPREDCAEHCAVCCTHLFRSRFAVVCGIGCGGGPYYKADSHRPGLGRVGMCHVGGSPGIILFDLGIVEVQVCDGDPRYVLGGGGGGESALLEDRAGPEHACGGGESTAWSWLWRALTDRCLTDIPERGCGGQTYDTDEESGC